MFYSDCTGHESIIHFEIFFQIRLKLNFSRKDNFYWRGHRAQSEPGSDSRIKSSVLKFRTDSFQHFLMAGKNATHGDSTFFSSFSLETDSEYFSFLKWVFWLLCGEKERIKVSLLLAALLDNDLDWMKLVVHFTHGPWFSWIVIGLVKIDWKPPLWLSSWKLFSCSH